MNTHDRFKEKRMKEYKVMASSMTATYRAGRFVANSKEEAIRMAQDDYRKSELGRTLKDCGAFRFYVVSDWPD